MSNKWTKQEIQDLSLGVGLGLTHGEIGEVLGRTGKSINRKASKLKIRSTTNKLKTDEMYRAEVPEGYRVLEEYLGANIKILHQHEVCGHLWAVKPNGLLSGYGCPKCATSGFQPNKSAITYLIYFHALDTYKVGITNRSIKARFSEEPQPYEVILERHFDKGKEAKELETKWLNNLKPFLYNTNELKSGNTETFIYEGTIHSRLSFKTRTEKRTTGVGD
jgi:predicted  nucleic acid-binding Zn-ribbon protein